MLEIYLRQYFKIKKPDEFFDDEEESQIRQIHKTKKEIFDVDRKKFDEQLNLAGMNFIIENLEKNKPKISTDYHEMRSIVDEMTMEKENLEAQLSVLQQEAYMLVEQATNEKINKIFCDFYEEKYKRVL